MSSELQRDIERLDAYMSGVGSLPLSAFEACAYEAWQRIRARFTPDREEIAWRMFRKMNCCDESKAARKYFEESKGAWLRIADAAIAAVQNKSNIFDKET